MKSEPVRPPINGDKLQKHELNKLMHDYDFVQWKNDLDRRADEAKRSGKYKKALDGRATKPSP